MHNLQRLLIVNEKLQQFIKINFRGLVGRIISQMNFKKVIYFADVAVHKEKMRIPFPIHIAYSMLPKLCFFANHQEYLFY